MPRNKEISEQMRAESREKLLNTARQLFAERGYAGCSMSDIARSAKMSKANIYWYFSSKQELFRAVLMDGFQELGTLMNNAATSSDPAIEKLNTFLKNFITLSKDQSGDEFITIVFNFIAQGGTEKFAELGISTLEIGSGYHQALNTIFAQGQAEGTISSDEAPDMLSTFFFSFINGLMLMYPVEWKDIPYETIRSALFRLLGASEDQ